jgi:hypothetical protein
VFNKKNFPRNGVLKYLMYFVSNTRARCKNIIKKFILKLKLKN